MPTISLIFAHFYLPLLEVFISFHFRYSPRFVIKIPALRLPGSWCIILGVICSLKIEIQNKKIEVG